MRILYICTGNCFRSPTAEALTREYHPEYEVESAGIDPTDFISKPATDFLRDRGAIQFVKPSPDLVSQRALDEADRIVCMMPVHKEGILDNFDVDESKIEVWNVKDGILPDVDPEDSLNQIDDRVQNL